MTDIFQAIKIIDDLEDAVIDTLETWFPVYVRELETQHPTKFPLGSLPPLNSYVTADKLDKENADTLPCAVIISPGLNGKAPKQEGDGSFRTFWAVGVGIFVGAPDRINTKRLARTYTAIARSILLQKQSLGGFADGTAWLDESYDDNLEFTDNQTISAGQVIFEIEVAGVVNRRGGPAVWGGPPPSPDPATQPGSTWPSANKVTTTVELKES